MTNIVIIGNTAGAFACADSLRKSGKDLSLTVISPEEYPAYKKGLVYDVFFGRMRQEDIFLCDKGYYQQNNIRLIPDARINQINTKKKRVDIKDGDKLSYDYLLLACGRKAQLPDIHGANKAGIVALDTLSNLRQINDLLVLIKHAAVIGETQVSFDFARELVNKEIDTNLFSSNGNFPQDEKLNIVSDQKIAEFIGEGEVKAVKLDSGKVYAASMVVLFGETAPEAQLFRDSDIELLDSAVVVDEKLRTNIPNIFAIGNLTLKPGQQVKSWQDAFNEGESVASSILEDIGST